MKQKIQLLYKQKRQLLSDPELGQTALGRKQGLLEKTLQGTLGFPHFPYLKKQTNERRNTCGGVYLDGDKVAPPQLPGKVAARKPHEHCVPKRCP